MTNYFKPRTDEDLVEECVKVTEQDIIGQDGSFDMEMSNGRNIMLSKMLNSMINNPKGK